MESDGRLPFLEQACAGDFELRTVVERLLQFSNRDPNCMESPVIGEVALEMPLDSSPGLNPGDLIGH
jgi:hypothetical protein